MASWSWLKRELEDAEAEVKRWPAWMRSAKETMKIQTKADYQKAITRIDMLLDAKPDTPDGEELDTLVDLVKHYETEHVKTT